MLIVSKDVLEIRSFSSEDKCDVWENSSVRHWLNSDFYNNSFTELEKEIILKTSIHTESKFGNSVSDKLFLLSEHELNKYYKHNYVGRIALYNNDAYEWLLRTPSKQKDHALIVSTGGGVRDWYFSIGTVGIRPAMWIGINE